MGDITITTTRCNFMLRRFMLKHSAITVMLAGCTPIMPLGSYTLVACNSCDRCRASSGDASEKVTRGRRLSMSMVSVIMMRWRCTNILNILLNMSGMIVTKCKV
jgi:hypothetical protein